MNFSCLVLPLSRIHSFTTSGATSDDVTADLTSTRRAKAADLE
jgi:hypothetical protein